MEHVHGLLGPQPGGVRDVLSIGPRPGLAAFGSGERRRSEKNPARSRKPVRAARGDGQAMRCRGGGPSLFQTACVPGNIH